MAEAEEVISDVARHTTIYAQRLWQRYRASPDTIRTVTLRDVATRLDLLITAVFGAGFPMRVAQPPAHATMLSILFRHDRRPRLANSVPATDGASIWLPPDLGIADAGEATMLYRAMALQQVYRARRGGAEITGKDMPPLLADVYLLLEAYSADLELTGALPGMTDALEQLRTRAPSVRPPLHRFRPQGSRWSGCSVPSFACEVNKSMTRYPSVSPRPDLWPALAG